MKDENEMRLTPKGIKLIQETLTKFTPEEQIKFLIECAIHKGEVADYCDKCLETELAEKDRQIAELKLRIEDMSMSEYWEINKALSAKIAELKQSYDVTYADCENRLVDMRKEISALKKELGYRKQEIIDLEKERNYFMDRNSKLPEQLANAENETLDKVITEIEIEKTQVGMEHRMSAIHGIIIKRLDHLKSALLAMKKEAKI